MPMVLTHKGKLVKDIELTTLKVEYTDNPSDALWSTKSMARINYRLGDTRDGRALRNELKYKRMKYPKVVTPFQNLLTDILKG